MGAAIERLYTGCGHVHNSSFDWLKLYWQKHTKLGANFKNSDALFKEVNELKGTDISPMLFNHSAQHFDKSITSASGVVYGDENYEITTSLRRNAQEFSVYKTAYYTEKLKDRTKEERTGILNEYERQLKVEGDMTARATSSAIQWQEVVRTKDIYPMLEYMPSRSVDKRAAHQKFYGIIKPIDDAFWDDHYPPNGWNCKCPVRKSDAAETPGEFPNNTTPKGMVGNVGKQQRIFAANHPFISAVSNKGKRIIKAQFEGFKSGISYGKKDLKLKNGSSVNVHLYADDADLKTNFDAAELVASEFKKTDIKITPHINADKTKNPEFLINGQKADLKQQNGGGIKSNISNAVAQGCETVVFQIGDNYPHSIERFKQQVNGALMIRDGQIKRVIIIDKDGAVSEFKAKK